VVVEMLMLDAALVSTDQPSLEQRGDEVDARHDFVRRVGAAAEDRDLMLVTGRRQSGITPPAVGVNHRPALHSALDEGKQAVCRDIFDLLKADAAKPPAVLLDCYGDDGLALGFSASRTLFRATNIGFINLDRTRQQVPARPDHGAAQLVQPGPGSFVAAKPQSPLEAERTDPILLAGDEPHRQNTSATAYGYPRRSSRRSAMSVCGRPDTAAIPLPSPMAPPPLRNGGR